MAFDPNKVERKHIVWDYSRSSEIEPIVRAKDYDALLALLNSERVPPASFTTYAEVRKNIESGMAIGAEHAKGIVAQVQAKFDEASKRLLDDFEERYAQGIGKKPVSDDEIKGETV